MRRLMVIIGYINGKIGVRCQNCLRLKDGRCFGTKIPEDEQYKQRTCGFWKRKYAWIKRQSAAKEENIKLKNNYE